MPTTDTSVPQVVVNKLTKAQYDAATKSPTEFYAVTDATISYNDLSDKPTIPAAQVNSDWNASSGVAQILNKPTLATVATSGSYNDLTDKPDTGLVEMAYGESNAWAKFIAAYQAKKIVYCRASSNSNPATGTQGRKAFMAYVNNAENPTEVEFQYVRSVSSKTASQPVDQVFVYKLTSASGGTWTVQTRDMGPKLAAGTNASVSYSSGTYTVSATDTTYTAGTNVSISAQNVISATDTTYSNMTGATSGAAGAAGLVPAPAAGDQGKFLQGDGTWASVQSGPTVVQTTGQSTTDVMSQKAVTDIIGNVETILQTLNSGNGAQ